MSSPRFEKIDLRDAAARFLTDDWARLVALAGSEEKALEALSWRNDGIIAFTRRAAMKAGNLSPEREAEEKREEAIYLAKEAIKEKFAAMLKSGLLMSSGIFSGTMLLQNVPSELSEKLTFDFPNNKAFIPALGASPERSFIAVQIWEPVSNAASDKRHGEMVAWLTKRRAESGREKKEALKELNSAQAFAFKLSMVRSGKSMGARAAALSRRRNNQKIKI
jgi:hypothetical protein